MTDLRISQRVHQLSTRSIITGVWSRDRKSTFITEVDRDFVIFYNDVHPVRRPKTTRGKELMRKYLWGYMWGDNV